jgi:hypothetical protein
MGGTMKGIVPYETPISSHRQTRIYIRKSRCESNGFFFAKTIIREVRTSEFSLSKKLTKTNHYYITIIIQVFKKNKVLKEILTLPLLQLNIHYRNAKYYNAMPSITKSQART